MREAASAGTATLAEELAKDSRGSKCIVGLGADSGAGPKAMGNVDAPVIAATELVEVCWAKAE